MVLLIFTGQSSFITAISAVPEEIFADTLIGSDPFIEGLELIATEDRALIAQYYQWGGQKKFPLNPNTAPFENLAVMYIISSNQANWRNYWPRSIWEFRDGATVFFQFNQDMSDSLADADEIADALEPWMETNLDILYGATHGGVTTLAYWGYMSPENHSNFIRDEFFEVFSPGGFTNFITNEVLASAPVSVVGTGIVKVSNDWSPLAVAAFIQDGGIDYDASLYNMSISHAFGDYSGSIQPAPNSYYTIVNFQLPYVVRVHDSAPLTDNLYPELTGKFDWTLKAMDPVSEVVYIDKSYEDIFVTYSAESESIDTFPQITADLSVDVEALRSPDNPVLNYTITMENTGNEKAYDTTFAWDIGNEPEPKFIPIFDNDTYSFNPDLEYYWDFSTGELVASDPGGLWTLIINGWFTYKNGTLVTPLSQFNVTGNDLFHLDYEESLKKVYNKTFFTFSHSSNVAGLTLESGNYALAGTIGELNSGESETFWWAISDLPAENDKLIALAWEVTNSTNYDYNLTTFDNTSSVVTELGFDNLKDYLVQESLAQGSDLRYPLLNPEFTPGVMFVYNDTASRRYFGWSNGLIIQLYDDEAILKTTVSLNSTIYELYEIAEINVTIENIGDAPASDVQIQGYRAYVGPNWELKDLQAFSEETYIGTINPGESKTHSFYRQVVTSIGIIPLGVVVDYTTEKSQGIGDAFQSENVTNLGSNLILGLVMPKDENGDPQQTYPTPIVNVSVTWTDENGGEIENGDTIEIRAEVKNIGSEDTPIKILSYFPTRMAKIDISGSYSGNNFKVTDASGNTITGYDEGFAFDYWDYPISVAGVDGLNLAVGETIVFYYRISVENASVLIVPPVAVEYSSRYEMISASGVEGSESGGEGSPLGSVSEFPLSSNPSQLKFSVQSTSSEGGSSWTSYSGSSLMAAYAAVGPDGNNTGTNGVDGFTTMVSFIRDNMKLMIVVLAIPVIVLIFRERRKKR